MNPSGKKGLKKGESWGGVPRFRNYGLTKGKKKKHSNRQASREKVKKGGRRKRGFKNRKDGRNRLRETAKILQRALACIYV